MSVSRDDEFPTAMHEAGHAVAAAVTRVPFRYVTIRPRDPGMAGRVRMPAAGARACRGRWRSHIVTSAAGLIAQDLWLVDQVTGMSRDQLRGRYLVPAAGIDLQDMRRSARYAWHCAQDPAEWGVLTPGVSPDATVLDLVENAWPYAVRLVHEHWAAVLEVAAELVTHRRALSQARVRHLVDAYAGQDPHSEPGPCALTFWPQRHSRLAWRPAASGPGTTRT